MWLLLEDGRLMNTDLVTHVEFRDSGVHEGKATCWGYGVPMSAESKIAGDYFRKIRADLLRPPEKPKALAATPDSNIRIEAPGPRPIPTVLESSALLQTAPVGFYVIPSEAKIGDWIDITTTDSFKNVPLMKFAHIGNKIPFGLGDGMGVDIEARPDGKVILSGWDLDREKMSNPMPVEV